MLSKQKFAASQGNYGNYGDPGNSLLPAVFLTGRGIPLSLCVIHAAVGRRAGLHVTGALPDGLLQIQFIRSGPQLAFDLWHEQSTSCCVLYCTYRWST